MIDDIKEAVDNVVKATAGLTTRDTQGITKIQFELDLLKAHEKKSKKKTLKDLDSDDSGG